MLANVSDNNMLKIVYGDILDFDMSNVFPKSQSTEWDDSPPKLRIIGNLPFNVSTPLIFRWMEDISHHRGAWSFGRTKMLLTFQDEVADRLIAQPNKEGRCRASVVCQNYCDIFKKFKISGEYKNMVPMHVPYKIISVDVFELSTFNYLQKLLVKKKPNMCFNNGSI